MAEQSTNYTITMIVHDVPGTMLRVAQVFTRRGVNIDSIHVTHRGAPEEIISASGQPLGSETAPDSVRRSDSMPLSSVSVSDHKSSTQKEEIISSGAPKDGPWSEMVVGVRGVERIDQITRQLEKLIDVHHISVKTK